MSFFTHGVVDVWCGGCLMWWMSFFIHGVVDVWCGGCLCGGCRTIMSLRLNFCRSVPPEFLRSLLGIEETFGVDFKKPSRVVVEALSPAVIPISNFASWHQLKAAAGLQLHSSKPNSHLKMVNFDTMTVLIWIRMLCACWKNDFPFYLLCSEVQKIIQKVG